MKYLIKHNQPPTYLLFLFLSQICVCASLHLSPFVFRWISMRTTSLATTFRKYSYQHPAHGFIWNMTYFYCTFPWRTISLHKYANTKYQYLVFFTSPIGIGEDPVDTKSRGSRIKKNEAYTMVILSELQNHWCIIIGNV